ncbi:MAG: class IV adenylate cyclase, partial [archaeon]
GYRNGVHAKKETEFIVKDISDFLSVIDEFGFRRWLRKEKKTELYRIEKNFHIELNNVRGLGWFVEVEYLTDESHIEYAQRKVEEIIKKLGISKSQIVKSGYTKLLWDKRH